MTFGWGDRTTLVEAATLAVGQQKIAVGGGWTTRSRQASTNLGGTLSYGDSKWAVCCGQQRPKYARLLDATAAFKCA